MSDIQSLTEKVEKLQKSLELISNGMAVEWDDKTTDSGIQLMGGPTTVSRKGVILSTFLAPDQKTQTVQIMLFCRRDDGEFVVLPPQAVKPSLVK